MAGLSDNQRGALLMIVAMAFFTFNDACMKALGGDVPLMQALFLRGVIVTALLYGIAAMRGGLAVEALASERRRLALRALGEIAAAIFFVAALFNMPLANVTAILQVTPLAITLAAALVFKEPVGWRRFAAIAVGFAGVMLIVRPGTEGFTVYSVLVLLSVAAVVLRDLATRRMRADLPAISVAFVTSAALTVVAGLACLFTPWKPIGPAEALQLAGAAVFVLTAYVVSVTAMRVGDVGFIAPFRYTSLVVALVLGLVLFGEWPDALTLTGSAVVVATGLFALWREQVAARRGARIYATRSRGRPTGL